MAESELEKAVAILGGQEVFQPKARTATLTRRKPLSGRKVLVQATRNVLDTSAERINWTQLIRAGIASVALQNTGDQLRVSVNELSQHLRLPARTIHRRLAKGQRLSAEETERTCRVARALAKAQQLLGDENGRLWLLGACQGLGGDKPITLLDTADGFGAVIDELGRLEYGVIS